MSVASAPFGRRTILVAAMASLAVTPLLDAQTGDRAMEGHYTPRRYVYPVIGAAVGGLASLVYFWSGPRTLPGTCAGPACVAVVSLGSGAFVGWLVGKEKDELHTLRYRGGVALFPKGTSVDLTGEPSVVIARDTLVAALGTGGVQIFRGARDDSKPRSLATRAQGLRGVNDATLIPSSTELALTAGGGLYRFPMIDGLGVNLRPAPASAVAVLGNDFVVGAGNRVERVHRNATEASSSLPGVFVRDTVRALKVDPRGVVWSLTSTELLALRPAGDSLAIVSRLAMPRGAQRFDIDGNLAAVAAGDSGVRFVDITDVESPKTIADWRGATRFAYDVALAKGKAYVASGIDGLARVSLKNGTSPYLEGLARELGFIQSVAAAPPFLWVLDHSGTVALKRIPIDF